MKNRETLKITIRHPVSEDQAALAEIAALAKAQLSQTYRPTPEAIAQSKSSKESFTPLVAMLQNRLVGAVEYTLRNTRIYFKALSVHPDFQRRGIARAIIQEMETLGQAKGASHIALNTTKETGNVEIYQKIGFQAISEKEAVLFESHLFDKLTDVYMEKVII